MFKQLTEEETSHSRKGAARTSSWRIYGKEYTIVIKGNRAKLFNYDDLTPLVTGEVHESLLATVQYLWQLVTEEMKGDSND
jgi:hypothetical protein